jgi:hypothetical protein
VGDAGVDDVFVATGLREPPLIILVSGVLPIGVTGFLAISLNILFLPVDHFVKKALTIAHNLGKNTSLS